MATNITAIQPREINFRTQANADWLDGLIVWQAGAGGIVAGGTNSGNGGLVIASVAPQAQLGHHILSVTSLDGVPRFTIEHPNGSVTAGVVGLPLVAGGMTLTLGQGSRPFAVDDTFVIAVLPVPVDLTGISFTYQARLSVGDPNVALAASSAPSDGSTPTILTGTTGGQISMNVPRTAMARSRFTPASYVYDILASADGRTVPAFFGTHEHVDGVTYLS